jgi:hypothetical protein
MNKNSGAYFLYGPRLLNRDQSPPFPQHMIYKFEISYSLAALGLKITFFGM